MPVEPKLRLCRECRTPLRDQLAEDIADPLSLSPLSPRSTPPRVVVERLADRLRLMDAELRSFESALPWESLTHVDQARWIAMAEVAVEELLDREGR